MRLRDLGEGIRDLMPEIRELKAEDKRSKLQRVYYAYIKEPKPIYKLTKISLRGDSLPKKNYVELLRNCRKGVG